ncbi:MAG: alkaline phosphatase family protein, partial [Alistipes sp.]|nr:alkaline phosphatase family protein [Alistipes sp.]
MKRLLILCLTILGLNIIDAFAAPNSATQAERPRLVVNIVVGSMRGDDLDRYYKNLTENGFRRLMREGITYTEAYYNFSTLSVASGLATLTTGAN